MHFLWVVEDIIIIQKWGGLCLQEFWVTRYPTFGIPVLGWLPLVKVSFYGSLFGEDAVVTCSGHLQ